METIQKLKHTFIPSVKRCHRAPAFTHRWLSVYSIGLLLSQIVLGVSYYSGTNVETPETMSRNIVYLTNIEREKNELSDLKTSDLLTTAASAKLNDMFANNYWDHYSPSGKKPWDFIIDSNYSYTYAGENLAKGFVSSDSTVKAWMESQSHKNNILSSRYNDIGVAVGSGNLGGKPTTLVVQMFGAPKANQIASASPQNTDSVVLGIKEGNKISFNPSMAAIPSKLPFFLIWITIFALIIFDGAMLRRCGLHTSKKHLFEFRSALLVNGLALTLLFVNFVAIA